MKRILILLIRGYQYSISPLLGNRCRFSPSCSEYARLAVIQHGPINAFILSIWRLGRCHPFSRGGFDPVPEKLEDTLRFLRHKDWINK